MVSRISNSRILHLIALTALLSACGDTAGSVPSEAPSVGTSPASRPATPSRQPSVWTSAIEAHGGRAALERIHSLRASSRALEPGQPAKTVVSTVVFPDRLRFEETALDAQLVLALDGPDAWKTLDGVRLALEADEERELRNEMLAIRLSLFVRLDPETDIDVRDDGRQDGLDWLEVEFLRAAAPPYRLGFDPVTHLLRRAEWSARLHGRGAGRKSVRMDLEDYRSVEGVMVSFAAAYTVAGAVLGRNEVDHVDFNPTIGAGLFSQPPTEIESPILRRKTEARRVATMAASSTSVEELEKAAREAGFVRRGPIFRIVAGAESHQTVLGMAVAAEESRSDEPRPKGLTVEDLPSSEALTLVVANAGDAAFAAAHARLLAHALEDGLIPGDTFRHVMWNKDVWQIQLPVRAP